MLLTLLDPLSKKDATGGVKKMIQGDTKPRKGVWSGKGRFKKKKKQKTKI